MNQELKTAIEGVLKDPSINYIATEKIEALRKAYGNIQQTNTETRVRLDFLESLLQTGMRKRDAAIALVEYEKNRGVKITQVTAESIVYIAFSGLYRLPKKGVTNVKQKIKEVNKRI